MRAAGELASAAASCASSPCATCPQVHQSRGVSRGCGEGRAECRMLLRRAESQPEAGLLRADSTDGMPADKLVERSVKWGEAGVQRVNQMQGYQGRTVLTV
eukprot:44105-Chlamydomonas_euryale.AAC.6